MAVLLQNTDRGLHCPADDFYIAPWRPVPLAATSAGKEQEQESDQDEDASKPALS